MGATPPLQLRKEGLVHSYEGKREKIKPWSDADEKKLVVIMLQLLGLPDRAHPAVGSGPSGARTSS